MSTEEQLTAFRTRLSEVSPSDITQTFRYPEGYEPKPLEGFAAIGQPIRLGTVLGYGGMGTVFLGNQGMPAREVAVKKANEKDGPLERLLIHEASITGQLEHPNIVPIHEIRKSEDNEIEVVMKRIQGTTLRELLEESFGEEGVLDTCLNILIQAAHALAFAHSQQVIHRDIKTQNIMIGDFGETYLLDWGIAIQRTKIEEFDDGMVGTPSSMAPEMLTGRLKDVTEATDIYLIGATLHEVLMGAPRHQSEDSDLFTEIKRSEPFDYPDHIPRELADLANQCCHLDPAQRIKSAVVFREKLEQFQKHKNAYELLKTGKKELEIMEAILQLENRTPLERTKLYYHLHRARFAFERALALNPKLVEAMACLRRLVNDVARMLLDEGSHDTAAWFGESSGLLDPELRKEIEAASQHAQSERKEEVRLQSIGKRHDFLAYANLQTTIALGLLLCGLILLSSAFEAGRSLQPLSAADLVEEALILFGGAVGILFLLRKKLLQTEVGQRAIIAVLGALGGLVLIRWACGTFGMSGEEAITLEKFLVGMTFITAFPAIPSGMVIGFLCIGAGCFGVLVPDHRISSSIVLLIFIMGLLGWDAYRALKHAPESAEE